MIYQNILIKKVVIICSIIFLSAYTYAESSSGGLFIEPSVSYETGSSSTNYPSPLSNSTGTVNGFGLGARLGIHLKEVIFLGLDGRYSMPQFKDSSVNYDANSVLTNWGPVVGLQMPNLGLRVWTSYIVDSELNPEISGNYDIKLQKGTGYRIGAGFRITAFSLNVEYQSIKYSETKLEQIGPFNSGTTFDSVTPENKTWLLSLSFPLEM